MNARVIRINPKIVLTPNEKRAYTEILSQESSEFERERNQDIRKWLKREGIEL